MRRLFLKAARTEAVPPPSANLYMYRTDLRSVPRIPLPSGYSIRPYQPGDERSWAVIQNGSIGPDWEGGKWTADKCRKRFIGDPRYVPGGMFFVCFKGAPVGSVMGIRGSPTSRNLGQIHMVGLLEGHRGRSIGAAMTAHALRWLRTQGFTSAGLITQDYRVPAIRMYMQLGLKPLLTDTWNAARWRKVAADIRRLDRKHRS